MSRVPLRHAAGSAIVVLASYAGGLALLLAVLQHGPTGTTRVLDVAVGAVACLGLLWRHRAPVGVGVVLAVLASVVASAGVANMVALYFVARQRTLALALGVGVADVVAGWVFWLVHPGNDGLALTLTVNAAIAAAVVAWGALLQSQHALLDAFRERAERAERDEVWREERIRAAERTRIAREMHDVVAHRISLVALHAGGLEVAQQHGPEQVREAAHLIRSASVGALDELRSAIGILREGEPRSLEQPGLDRLGDLLSEARTAGQRVDLDLDPGLVAPAGSGAGRDVYRIVQEGLTNARKHAPGQPVHVTVARSADAPDVMEVSVVNHCDGRSLGLPGSGSGLIGLRERAGLSGGTLRHRRTPAGDFELTARLPWR